MLTAIDLCSGVGAGFPYASLLLGKFELKGFCESDEWCQSILKRRFPGVRIYPDVKTLTEKEIREQLGQIDCVFSSPPCPPFSTEGQRLGADDERDCFPAVLATIGELQPRFAAIENVPGIVTCPTRPGCPTGSYYRGVLRSLNEFGYDAEWMVISSGHFGSPFIRERVLLVAVSRSVKLDWERATAWADQARGGIEEVRTLAKRRGTKPGYPMSVVSNPGELVRPLGVKSRDGIIRKQRAAAGNLLDPRVAAIALNRILYLSSIAG